MIIGTRQIDRDGPPLVIAEIGVNHDGDMGVAHELVRAAKGAGADAVKFQLFEAGMLLAAEAGLVTYQKAAADSAGELLEPLQLSAGQMKELVVAAHGMGLLAITTPFSPGLVEAAVGTGIDAIKVASPDMVNRPLVEAAMRTGLPLILAPGAATMEEIECTMGWLAAGDMLSGISSGALRDEGLSAPLSMAHDQPKGCTPNNAPNVFLHCVSSYPTPAERAALGGIVAMRARWPGMMVGYSDHTDEAFTGALAVAAGACVLEKHLTLDKRRKGPDHAASLEPAEMAVYVRAARSAFAMRGAMVKEPNSIELEVRMQARQSVVARRDLAAGEILKEGDLTVKRPGTGIPAAEFGAMVGRRLARGVKGNMVLQWADLLPEEGR